MGRVHTATLSPSLPPAQLLPLPRPGPASYLDRPSWAPGAPRPGAHCPALRLLGTWNWRWVAGWTGRPGPQSWQASLRGASPRPLGVWRERGRVGSGGVFWSLASVPRKLQALLALLPAAWVVGPGEGGGGHRGSCDRAGLGTVGEVRQRLQGRGSQLCGCDSAVGARGRSCTPRLPSRNHLGPRRPPSLTVIPV